MSDGRDTGYDGDGTAEDVLRWALQEFSPDIAYFCSFQDTVIIDLMTRIRPDVRIMAIDTGRLPEETYLCASDAENRFGIKVEWFFPRHEGVEELLREGGTHSFRESLLSRRQCCAIRKVEPFERALHGLRAWISGNRRDQSVTREALAKVEWDKTHDHLLKINPIADWTHDQVWDYIRSHQLPYNHLFDRGYTSIGCACCTRPVEAGEHPRAGRWWWESPEHKECGLHVGRRRGGQYSI